VDHLEREKLEQYQILLEETLAGIFGELDQEQFAKLKPLLKTTELPGGSILMRQGDASDEIYLVLAGRLQASILDEDQQRIILSDIGRGEPIGEMGVISGAPRTATITALRDCLLVSLTGTDFKSVLQSWPGAALPLASKLIDRLSPKNRVNRKTPRVVNLCVLPVHPECLASPLANEFGTFLMQAQRRSGMDEASLVVHDRQSIDVALGAGVADADANSPADYRRLLAWLDEQEIRHEMQLFAADAWDSPWTRLCLRFADHVLLVADADGDAKLSDVEQQYLSGAAPIMTVKQSLWLLHPDDRKIPANTARWLTARTHIPIDGMSHFHCRRGKQSDWQRLARIVSGHACGIVLAGGGARGFAHLGVMRALEEQGIDWDMAGGTSIGAVMAAYAAMDLPSTLVTTLAGHAFENNPTGDFNWFPMMSLLRGHRLKTVIRDAVVDALEENVKIEDLWKPFFCVASNYSRAQVEIMRMGTLDLAITASVSIPAAFPPILVNGDLLIDGGSFNNYPVDVMRASGASRIIGVDLSRDNYWPLSFQTMPSSWQLLVDRVLRTRKHRRFKGLPNLGAIVLNVSLMTGASYQKKMRELVDLQFQPDISRIGLLDWKAFAQVVDLGLQHARERLTADDKVLPRLWYANA
jgi:NTE family protein